MKKLTYLFLLFIIPFCSCGAVGVTDDNTELAEILAPDSGMQDKDTTNYISPVDLHIEQKIKRAISAHSGRCNPKKMSICVYDISTDRYVFKYNEKELMAPASCMKLLTAITAIDRLGDSYNFSDSLFIKGSINEQGTFFGSVILKMDDDPLFWDFVKWAKAVQAKGIKRIEGNIVMHLARRDTLRPHPSDKPWDIQYHKLPLMLKGEKYIKRIFINTLALRGIKVKENPFILDNPELNEYWTSVAKENEGDNAFDLNLMLQKIALDNATHGAECIAATNNPLLAVIDPMLIYSSNMKAESMFYHLDNVYSNFWQRHSQYGKHPHEVEKFLKTKLGIDTKEYGYVINDGSGLSPTNRLNSQFFIDLLLWAYNNKKIRDILINEALACPGVRGRTGSLKTRMSSGYTKGRVFCKTGTLVTIGGSSLAGYIHGLNGHWYAFCIIHKDTPVWNARDFQDRVCREIVR